MTGLVQTGTIANTRLGKYLNSRSCVQSKIFPSLWKYETLPVSFTLVVDYLGIKHVGKKSISHSLDTLKELYAVSLDRQGWKHLGFTLDWDFENVHVTTSMPNYVKKSLIRFQHQAPSNPVHSPSKFEELTCVSKVQHAQDEQESTSLSPNDLLQLQQVVGPFLCCAKETYLTMLVTINDLSQAQTNSSNKL